MVKQMKAMLASFERQGLPWWRALPTCEKAYNDSVHSVTGYTPFYMVFGRHPLPDQATLLEPAEEQLVQEFVHNTQSELARLYPRVTDKILANSIRDTARRNAGRTPTLDYRVGDYVYLETSALKHTPVLAPLRAGPYLITRLVAGGNAAYLEGFRYPFNVEFLTPTICYANGVNPHLTRHQLELGVVSATPEAGMSAPAIGTGTDTGADAPGAGTGIGTDATGTGTGADT